MLTGNSKTYYTQLRLDPLGKESADEMLSALLGSAPQLEALKRLISEKTEGNPFFMEEMVQVLSDEGAILRDGTSVRLTKPLGELKIPPTVQAILTARIDRLAPDCKELLQTLAVIGTEFRLGLVRKVSAQPATQLESSLSDLQLGEFIYEQPAVGDTEYTFKHALTHHVAYNSVLNERRRQLHGQIGAVLESIYEEALDQHAVELAHHYARSSNTVKGLQYCFQALRVCVERASTTEAVAHFDRALELLRELPDNDQRAELELDLRNTAFSALGDAKGYGSLEVEQSTSRAMELCNRPGINWSKAWTALYAIFFVQQLRPDVHKAEAISSELVARADAHKSVGCSAEAATWLGYAQMVSGNFDIANQTFERAWQQLDSIAKRSINSASSVADQTVSDLRIIQRAGTRQNNRVLSAWNLWFMGYPERALQRVSVATAIAQEPGILADVLGFATYIYEICRLPEQMRAHAEARLALANESGFLAGRALSEIYLGWADALAGDLESGIARMRRNTEELKAAGSEYIIDRCLSFIATALGRLKKFEGARRTVDEAFEFIEKSGQRFYEAELHRLRGELLWAEDMSNDNEAQECFHVAIDVARNQHAKSWELRATTSLARLMRDLNRHDEGRVPLKEIYGWFTEGFDTPDLKDARALLEELDGNAESVLQFWFAPDQIHKGDTRRARWFASDPEFDRLCKDRFLTSYEDAVRGRLADWKKAPRSCLALILLFDQFPRNMFRGTARAFETDAKALALSRHAIESGFDRLLLPHMRMFLNLPFEHSENLDDQFESVRLARALVAQNPYLAEAQEEAELHFETIRRFGRFPGRNRALGRQSTQEEEDFLKEQERKESPRADNP